MSEVKTEEITVLAEYDEIKASLVALKSEYEGKLYEVTTTAGMKEAKADRALFRTGRTDVEKVRKALKEPHLERGRRIDSDAKMIKEAFAELEEPVALLIKEEEDRKAAAKAEKERIEFERVAGIQELINGLRFVLSEYHPSKAIKAFIDKVEAEDLDDRYGEFVDMAKDVVQHSLVAAESALKKAQEREEVKAEAERVAAEMAAELAAKQAEAQKKFDEAEAEALSEDAAKDQTKGEKFAAGTAAAVDKVRGDVLKPEPEGYTVEGAFRRILELATGEFDGNQSAAMEHIAHIASQQLGKAD